MNIEIKVDAPSALSTIAGVETALAKVEAKGPDVGEALSQGLGAGAPAADKTKQSTQSLAEQMAKLAGAGKAFSGFADIFKREADVLEKIKGPAKEYAANLQALDSLLEKQSITTSEYAAQVTKMNQAIDGTKQATEQASAPGEKFSSVMSSLAMPAAGAAVLGLSHQIGSMVEEMQHAEDEYTNLSNKALKFVDSLHSQTQILQEQRQLSVDLQTTIDPVIEIYDSVRDGSDELRISHEEQLRVTKSLGEAMDLANKPLSEAGGLMARFAYALESGTLSGGDFKRMAKDVPELADVWAKHFGVTIGQLKSLIDQGKVTSRDLMNVLITDYTTLDKEHAKRKATNEAQIAEFTQQMQLLKGEGVTGLNSAMLAGMKPEDQNNDFAMRLKFGNDADAVKNGQQGQAAIDKMLSKANDIKNLTGEWHDMGVAADKAFAAGVNGVLEIAPKIGDLGAQILGLGRNFGLLADSWEHGLSPLGDMTKLVMDNAAKMGDARKQLVALQAAMKAGGPAGDDARKQYEALMTTLNNGRLPAMIKIFDSLHEPMRTFQEDSAAVNAMWKSGELSAQEYQYELMQLAKTDPGLQRFNDILADSVKRYDAAAAAAKRYADAAKVGAISPGAVGLEGPQFAASNRQALSDATIFTSLGKSGDDKQTEMEKRYIEVIDASAGPVDKYNDALLKLNGVKGLLSDDQYSRALTSLKEQYGAVASPAEKFAKEISDTKDLRDASIITETEYQKRLQDIGKEQEKLADSGHSMEAGLSRGWHSIRDEAQDSASTIASSMKGAFDEVNNDIVSMVTTGTADWGKLASTIEADFTKIALQKVEGSIFSAVAGKASDLGDAAATGVTTGTSAGTTMLAAAPGIGAAIGAAAALAMQAGSAAAGAEQGAASAGISAIAGSWAGSDTYIHAANGYRGRVGGVGGTDTKLFAAMVTPGEHVSIQTQDQHAAAMNGSNARPVVNVINQDDTRGKLAADFAAGVHDTSFVNMMKRNAGAVQALLRK